MDERASAWGLERPRFDRRNRLTLGAALGLIALCASAVAIAAPANDDFAVAETIPSYGGTVTTDNETATAQSGEPNHAHSVYGAPFHSVWFRWSPAVDGKATASTCGSAFDTRMAVYTGNAVSALTEVASNDDSTASGQCPGTKLSSLEFEAQAGVSYSIAVDTNGGIDGGHPRGEVRLELDAPGDETETSTTGHPVPVDGTAHSAKMPSLEPRQIKRGKRKGQWRFKTLTSAEKAIKRLEDDGLNVKYLAKAVPLRSFPKAQANQLKASPGSGGQIRRTYPKRGTDLVSTVAEHAKIRITYWDPASDRRYIRELEREAERKRKEEEERKRNRCKLLDVPINDVKRILTTRTYDEAAKVARFFNCLPLVDEAKWNDRIYTEIVTSASKHEKRNAVGLTVVRPKTPDFVITWREDPEKLKDAHQLSLVELANGNWVLPRSSRSTSQVTFQVNERATGRFAPGVKLEIFNESTGKRLLETKTNGLGEKTVSFKLPKETSLHVVASHSKGAERMAAARTLFVRELGKSFTTICGRRLALEKVNGKNTYRGKSAQLDRCRGLRVVPANLGDGRGTSARRLPTVEQTEALAATAGSELLAGTHNAISITGSNTIVAAAPGIIAAGGGNIIATGGLNRPRGAAAQPKTAWFGAIGDLFSSLVTNVSRAFGGGVSNTKAMLGAANAAAVQQTAENLANQGAAVPPDEELEPKGIGLISATAGNIIAAGGGNIIAAGGGNIISEQGAGLSVAALGLVEAGGSNIIAAGGGNLMPVYGGQIIATGGGN